MDYRQAEEHKTTMSANSGKIKISNLEVSELSEESSELSDSELESISGGNGTSIYAAQIALQLKDKCKYDPDSARLPCS
ncbi:MAG: hypothetical protein Tsb0014_28690 [Pleurocapsa sp.]